MEPWLEALIARGKQTGTLTFEEVDAAAPWPEGSDEERVAFLEQLLERFDNAGITLIDDSEPDELPPEPQPERDRVYHRDAAFEARLRQFGVPFSDAMASHDPATGLVFDAELIVPGEQALAAWLALRDAVPITGLWPVIGREQNEPDFPHEPARLDPRGKWWAWREAWRHDRNTPMPELTPEVIRADAAAWVAEAEKVPPTPWRFGEPPALEGPDAPLEPHEPNFAELFANEGPFRCVRQAAGGNDWPFHPFVRIRLYPTAVPWEVFAYSPTGVGTTARGRTSNSPCCATGMSVVESKS